MKTLLLALTLLFFTTMLNAQWNVDKSHSSVTFEVEHIVVPPNAMEEEEEVFTMGITNGRFSEYSVNFEPGADDFSDSKVEAVIHIASINTENVGRDEHLKSEAFFHAEKFPKMIFRSTAFERTGENAYKMVGNLTMKGVTKVVELAVTGNGKLSNSLNDQYISFTAEGLINRLDFGLKWNKLLESGAFRVSNYVKLSLQINLFYEGNVLEPSQVNR